jgi:hypothetical protein
VFCGDDNALSCREEQLKIVDIAVVGASELT